MVFAYTTRTIADENVPSRTHHDSKSSNRTMICCAGANNTFKCGWFMWELSLRTGRGQMTLRKTCVGAFAFFALTSVGQAADMQPVLKGPGAVDQQATGYVEVYTGWARTKFEFGRESERFDGWAL